MNSGRRLGGTEYVAVGRITDKSSQARSGEDRSMGDRGCRFKTIFLVSFLCTANETDDSTLFRSFRGRNAWFIIVIIFYDRFDDVFFFEKIRGHLIR